VGHWATKADGRSPRNWQRPNLAAKAAYRLFSTAPRGPAERDAEAKLAEKLTPLFDTAATSRIGTPDTFIQSYLWRTDQPEFLNNPRGRVLLVHGWTGQAMIMGLFVRPLMQAGFDVVAIDLPAHGRSGGRVLNMLIGARALIAAADRLGPFTGIVTHSFGGQVAALATEGGPPIGRGLTVERAVTVACPHSLRRLTRDFGQVFELPDDMQERLEAKISDAAGRSIESVSVGNLWAKAGTRVLAIHDELDDEVPYSEAQAIASAARNVTLMPISGLGHRRIIVASAVVRPAVRFLTGT
jgi:pimeloyl-ACP methyl ester carboxylesterase